VREELVKQCAKPLWDGVLVVVFEEKVADGRWSRQVVVHQVLY
jgi:hypothetical protein